MTQGCQFFPRLPEFFEQPIEQGQGAAGLVNFFALLLEFFQHAGNGNGTQAKIDATKDVGRFFGVQGVELVKFLDTEGEHGVVQLRAGLPQDMGQHFRAQLFHVFVHQGEFMGSFAFARQAEALPGLGDQLKSAAMLAPAQGFITRGITRAGARERAVEHKAHKFVTGALARLVLPQNDVQALLQIQGQAGIYAKARDFHLVNVHQDFSGRLKYSTHRRAASANCSRRSSAVGGKRPAALAWAARGP